MSSFLTSNLSSRLYSFLTDNPIYQNKNARLALFALGAGVVLSKALSLTTGLLSLLRRPKNLSARYGKGTWVVITGGSDGIGKGFAMELASQGFNIVLISRSKEKLEQAAKEIQLKYPTIQTKIIAEDLMNSHKEGFAQGIYDQVKDLDVSILINNAGIGYGQLPYVQLTFNQIRDLILLNCLSHAVITRAFLPDMDKRVHRSAIINVSSLASIAPLPVQLIYSSSKIFHDYLSRGLAIEHPNIDILSLKPGLVSTALTKYQKLGGTVISTEDCVKATLKDLGATDATFGHWRHKLEVVIFDLFSPSAQKSLLRKRMEAFKKKNAIEKKKEE